MALNEILFLLFSLFIMRFVVPASVMLCFVALARKLETNFRST